MKSFLSILLCLSIFLVSFQKSGDLKLTFKNVSNENFKSLEVNIRGKKFTFSNLNSHKKTIPVRVDDVYRYCYAKVITEKDTLEWQPEDFVGEKLITEGIYVMKFGIVTKNGKRYLVINNVNNR